LRWRPVAAFPSFRRALNYRNYRLFFAGHSMSLVGNWMNPTASAWLAYELSHSAFVVGLVPFANQTPLRVLAPAARVQGNRRALPDGGLRAADLGDRGDPFLHPPRTGTVQQVG
jgi:hypothetical protein